MRRLLEDINPERANEILLTYKSGNNFDEARVKRFANMMNTGTWKVNRSSFLIVRKGILMNGKHRLKAITISGKTIQMAMQYE